VIGGAFQPAGRTVGGWGSSPTASVNAGSVLRDALRAAPARTPIRCAIYYDAYTAQAAQTALGRSLAAFYTQDDDPTVNGSADANFLAGLIKTHIDSIRTTVLAAYSGAKFELLWPYDVNFATCYYTPDVPYPQGGRLNRAVNLPSQYLAQAGSGLDRLKMESLSWGSTYRNLTTRRPRSHFR
jgi:hypothetical protein